MLEEVSEFITNATANIPKGKVKEKLADLNTCFQTQFGVITSYNWYNYEPNHDYLNNSEYHKVYQKAIE